MGLEARRDSTGAGRSPEESPLDSPGQISAVAKRGRQKSPWQLVKATYEEWSLDKAPRMGAALAYYTIFSLAPLLLIAISVAGVVFGRKAAEGAIVTEIGEFVGTESAKAIQHMIESANRPAESTVASIAGLVVLLFGASGVFGEMQDALNTIWEVKPLSKSGVWPFIKERFLGFAMVLGTGFLLMVSLLLSAALTAVANFWRELLPMPPFSLGALDFILSFTVTTVLFAMIFKVLPDVKIAWRDVAIGAVMTAALFTIGKFLIGLYIGKSVSMSMYGAAAALVIVIAWVYYSAQIMYFGAEFTRVYALDRGARIVPKRGAIIVPKPKQEARV